jgi:hypothetical protein
MGEVWLDKEKVKAWLDGQREAERIIKMERVNFLLSLAPEKSLEIYLSFSSLAYKIRREPSSVLLKMRQCLEKMKEKRGNVSGSS